MVKKKSEEIKNLTKTVLDLWSRKRNSAEGQDTPESKNSKKDKALTPSSAAITPKPKPNKP